jgi:hypothetical protein
MKYLDLDLLENPYGKRVGGGYDTVRVGDGDRLHVKAPDGLPLCMQGRTVTNLRSSEGRVVDCYRCIKLMAMNSNAPYLRRDLTTASGVKREHLMIPGGRQGRMVADKKASPYAESGASPFKRGPAEHPTQPWMTKRRAMAKTYEERLSEQGVALPPYYLPPTPEEMEAAQEVSFYESPAAKRRAAADRRRAARVAASATMVANPQKHARHGLPYMTFGNPRYEAYAVLHRGVVISVVATAQEAKSIVRSVPGATYQSVMWDSDRLPVAEVRTNGRAANPRGGRR